MRVAGADPGTSSLDLLILEEGAVVQQARFAPAQLHDEPALPVEWLREHSPFDLVAGPSGYGLPLVRGSECSDAQLALMSLVRNPERGSNQGVAGFSAVARAFRDSGLPVVFLPGVIHLPTVPPHRKFNRIDMGTPDKLCVAALALQQFADAKSFCLVELGSAFTACLLVRGGEVVEGIGGTNGPVGWRSGGAWDGELAYLLSPLSKNDLFRGGVIDVAKKEQALCWYVESIARAIASLHVIAEFKQVVLSGKVLEESGADIIDGLRQLNPAWEIRQLPSLPGAWVKHSAQGAAIVADGLAGGRFAPIVERLRLRESSGSVLDWIVHPRSVDKEKE